jgi:hypothetical protein
MSAARLQSLLGLSDEELLEILSSHPLAVITGTEDSRPEVAILLDLLAEVEDALGATTLRRWLRANGGQPLRLLLKHDFAGFEDALEDLSERGFVISPRGPGASPPATSP